MTSLDAVAHQSRAQSAAAALRRAILDGRLPPGSKIVEMKVAAELGFSRGPLREALRSLEEEGLVVKPAYRGAYVAEVGPEEIQEIALLRLRLEPFAIELSQPALATEEGRGRLLTAMETLRAAALAGDAPGSIDAHMALHRVFYELSGHKMLLGYWRGWESQLRIYFALDASTFTTTDKLVEDHQKLVDLVLAGDLDAVGAELPHHIYDAARAAVTVTTEAMVAEEPA